MNELLNTLRVELSTNMVYRGVYSLFAFQETRQQATELSHLQVILHMHVT